MHVGTSKTALNSKTVVRDELENENVENFEPITDV
jgi:hypothetical protein